MVNKDFQIDDIIDMGYTGPSKKSRDALKTSAKYENKTLWSYTDALR